MGDLHESIRVACPLEAAHAHVGAFLERHGSDPNEAHFNLRLEPEALRALGLPREDRGVNVAIRSLGPRDDAEPRYRTRWTPEGDAPHTLFLGELALARAAEPAGDTFALRLDGRYEIPRDAPPRDPEGVYAKRVALATAAALLRSIVAYVTHALEAERTRGTRNGVTHGYDG